MTMWLFTHKHNCNPKFAQWSTDLHGIKIIFSLLLHKSFRMVFEKFGLACVKEVYDILLIGLRNNERTDWEHQ